MTATPISGPDGSSPMRPYRWSCPSWPVPASGSRCSSGAVVGYRRSIWMPRLQGMIWCVRIQILLQPLIDDLGEPVQLRAPNRCRPPIARRYRKAQHLLHALARNPEMTRRRTHAHPVPARETDLPIQFHGMHAPAPRRRKGSSGRVSLRPQRDNPPLPWTNFSPPFPHYLDVMNDTLSAIIDPPL